MEKKKKEKGFLHIALGKREVYFYTGKDVFIYDSLRDFIESKSKSWVGMSVYLKEDMFTTVREYLKQFYEVREKEIHKGKMVYYSIGTEKTRLHKTFYSLKYKTGTDEYSTITEILQQIDTAPDKPLSGYTKVLSEMLQTDEPMLKETVYTLPPSCSPLIYVKPRREFYNVKCYDATSFYPFMLTQELPHYDKVIKLEEMDLNDKRYTYYGTIQVHNIKTKNYLCTLSLRGEGKDNKALEAQGINVVHNGTALVSADMIELNGFLPFLLEELQDYTYSEIKISAKIYRFILKPDEKISQAIQSKFAIKQAKKRAGEYYLPEKILLNRVYGYFLTRGRKAPAHYSQYVIAKGKIILRRLALEMGLKDVIHMHTDSIKFIGNHEDVIEKYNATVPFEELGKFMHEGTMERVVYYQKNVAKYIMDGELRFKHGGISDFDMQPLFRESYESISKESEVYITTGYFYTDEDGLIPFMTKRKLGGKFYD